MRSIWYKTGWSRVCDQHHSRLRWRPPLRLLLSLLRQQPHQLFLHAHHYHKLPRVAASVTASVTASATLSISFSATPSTAPSPATCPTDKSYPVSGCFLSDTVCPCDEGNRKNCGDFASKELAQLCLVKCGTDVHGLDEDDDGFAASTILDAPRIYFNRI